MATIAPTVTEFRNEPLTDFTDPENVRRMEAALAKVSGEFDRTYPLIIGGRRITEGDVETSINPANPSQVVGRMVQCTADLALEAIRVADQTFESWRKVPVEERAEYIFRLAELMRERKFELAATMVYEVSKSWPEADADIAELIDFAEYYAREALRIGADHPMVPYPGETNILRYIPLGVGVVIPPWNFPGAIMGGMTMAAIVTGNTVLLKPASTSPVIAARFVELLDEVGVPAGVVNFIPGPGSRIGDLIVDHPRIRFIAFTGSKEVGIRIFERAAKVHPGQIWLKRTILEMGGKDSIVVDETADLEQAAVGIVQAAWGFQGQKCSACSRAIVVESAYDQVLQRVVELTRKLPQGDPSQQGIHNGAVIDAKAFRKIHGYIETAQQEGGRLVLGGEKHDEKDGYFIPNTIIADVKPKDTISCEEIFGPVLAFIKAKDFEDALAIANNTEFGLTGALFSQDRERIERASHDFHCGNLYFNRKCTGALVGVQPFGGFNMSGTDSKAGGPDYLLLFTQGKSITERL
jgi:1-pyrroline-5-carboxylate dehydrogenase